ncbi:MAG: c-type cytochrome [Gammaproteobacteria bacterium]|nr:c-type cytochrome [Gammaproteobacteria bacterium]
MKNFLKVVLFTVIVIGFFAGFSNFGIPQIEPAAPPKEEKLDLGSMSMEQFVALGEKVFNGKGNCPLCHNAVGGRAPMLDKIGVIAADRLADARYQKGEGKATNAGEYIDESMRDPSAFVVVGFGKAGSNDTVSPMPNVSTSLAEAEYKAVIAYLQESSGVDITVEIPAAAAPADGGDSGTAAADGGGTQRAFYATPEEMLDKLGCGACHKVASGVGEIGPDLTQIGAVRCKEYLRRAVLDPAADIPAGFAAGMMPANYGDQLYAKEVEMLTDYLAGLGGPAGGCAGGGATAVAGTPDTPEAISMTRGCTACHKMAGMAVGTIGPDLTKIGAAKDEEYLKRAVLEPNADIAEGFKPDLMPAYKDLLSDDELKKIVGYLAGLK